MNKKIIISTIFLIFVLVFSFFAFSKEKEKSKISESEINKTESQTESESENQIILFYGDGCPHCAIVEKYLKDNNVEEKIAFSQKEVYYNEKNAKELESKAKICKISTGSIGVPFLWNGEKCLIGDQDIVEFFKQKINEK